MRGSRLLLIVGAILIIGALAVGAIFLLGGRGGDGGEEGTPTPTPEIPKVEVVVAAQDIPRGTEIIPEMARGDAPAVTTELRTVNEVPDGAVFAVEDVVGRVARVDIVRDSLILAGMLVEEPPGSSASLQIPDDERNLVAYALPVARYSSVAWALQPGDYVDMIISLLVVDVDEEFQSVEPSRAQCLSPSEDPACAGMGGPMGRLEVMPNGWLVNLTPSESQRPRLVTQLTIQSALVLRVGDWPIEGEEPLVLMPEPTPTPTPVPEGEEGAVVEEPQTLPTPLVAPLTLAITRQDALVLDYAQLMGANITFVLRRTGDVDRVTTESVTLQYLMDRYNIELPPKLPYGSDPRIIGFDTINRAEAESYQPPGATTAEE
jgi:Flp pilus assembly protein CpaB